MLTILTFVVFNRFCVCALTFFVIYKKHPIRVRPINRYCRLIGRWIGKTQKSQYRIGIGSADYKGPYRLIGMGTKRAQIWANLNPSKRFEPLKYFDPCLETFEP